MFYVVRNIVPSSSYQKIESSAISKPQRGEFHNVYQFSRFDHGKHSGFSLGCFKLSHATQIMAFICSKYKRPNK